MKRRLRSRNLWVAAVLTALVSAAHSMPSAGDVPPPDVGHDSTGKEVMLTAYAGKVVVVSFWATWCPQCINELPILEAVQNKVGKDRIEVIAVNTEDSSTFRRVSRAMRDNLHLDLLSDANGEASKAYGVNGIPHLVIIGRDGRIVQVHRGYSESSLDGIVEAINQALTSTP